MGAEWRGDHASHDEQRGNGMSGDRARRVAFELGTGGGQSIPTALAAYLNPLLKEAGLTKPTAAHPSGGPVAGGAIGTSGMPLMASGRERPPDSDACKQAPKLGVIEASYASAIIGVLSPVSSHC